jgi:adenine-specific DNA-methyltransferase
MKTGLLVDFREREWLTSEMDGDSVPLLWAYNFNGERIHFPVQVNGKPQYLKNTERTKRLQMKMGNYLLLKRFTSKEEKRRLQCALFFEDDFTNFHSISTENHLNFIAKEYGKIQKEELYGLYVVFNSSYLDRYFRILSGSTQVNANEINAIPFPSLEQIQNMGKQAAFCSDLTESVCDMILEKQFLRNPVSAAI